MCRIQDHVTCPEVNIHKHTHIMDSFALSYPSLKAEKGDTIIRTYWRTIACTGALKTYHLFPTLWKLQKVILSGGKRSSSDELPPFILWIFLLKTSQNSIYRVITQITIGTPSLKNLSSIQKPGFRESWCDNLCQQVYSPLPCPRTVLLVSRLDYRKFTDLR